MITALKRLGYLASFVLSLNVAHADSQACGSLWAEYPISGPSKSAACIPVRESDAYRLFVEDGALYANGSLEALDQAIASAYGKLSGYGDIPKPTFVVLKTAPERYKKTLAVAFAKAKWTLAEGCPIFIMPKGAQLSSFDFRQLVVHEFFHCFQRENFANQFLGPGKNDAGQSVNDWWTEGSADYFSALTIPEGKIESITYDPNQALHLQSDSYGTHLFFSSLASGDSTVTRVRDLIKAMPTKGGAMEQLVALAKVPQMEERFHDFARAFDLSQILKPGTLKHYSTPELVSAEALQIYSASAPILTMAKPFEMRMVTANFPPGGRYKMTPRSIPWGRASFRQSVTGTGSKFWEDIPYDFETACSGGTQRGEFLFTQTTGHLFEKPVGVEMEYEPLECKCRDELLQDPCVRGQWRLENDSIRHLFEGLPGVKLHAVHGAVSLNVSADSKSADLAMSDLTLLFQSEMNSDSTLLVKTIFNGSLLLEHRSETTTQICTRPLSAEGTVKTIVTHGELVTEDEVPLFDAIGSIDYLDYACTPDRLTLERDGIVAGKPGRIKLEFHRH